MTKTLQTRYIERIVVRTMVDASVRDGVTDVEEFARRIVRAVLAPGDMNPPGAVPKHLALLEEALAIVDCEKCHRHPTVTFSHDKTCAADTRARLRTDPHAEPPVQIL